MIGILQDKGHEVAFVRKRGWVCCITAVLCILSLLPAGRNEAGASDWKYIGKDMNDCQWFYDAENVKHLPDQIALVWLKRMVNDERRNEAVWSRMNEKQPVEGYDRWAYEVGLMELNCGQKTIRQLSITDYDLDGKFLKARKIEENMGAITPSSMGEILYEVVCMPPAIELRKILPGPPRF